MLIKHTFYDPLNEKRFLWRAYIKKDEFNLFQIQVFSSFLVEFVKVKVYFKQKAPTSKQFIILIGKYEHKWTEVK